MMRKWFSAAVALLLLLMLSSGAMAASAKSAAAPVPKSLNGLARQIVRECITPGMSQFEKAVALYDWLIDHTVYRGSTTKPYTVLRYGEASCGGYANAYTALLSKAGIKSRTISGRMFSLKHTWNLVRLGGKWYHVDVRMGDHLAEAEGKYRWFGMSDEQARTYYSFKKANANAYAFNHAYATGQLEKSIAYARSAIHARIAAGKNFFIVDLAAQGAPPELADPFSRITVKNALNNLSWAYPGVPDKAKAALTLTDNLLLVNVKVPTYRVQKLTATMPIEIVIEVEGANFSAIEPLELGGKVLIMPAHATQKRLYWSSSREKTAIVDQSGRVNIVGPGIAKIKVAAVDGSKRSCYYKVNVKLK